MRTRECVACGTICYVADAACGSEEGSGEGKTCCIPEEAARSRGRSSIGSFEALFMATEEVLCRGRAYRLWPIAASL